MLNFLVNYIEQMAYKFNAYFGSEDDNIVQLQSLFNYRLNDPSKSLIIPLSIPPSPNNLGFRVAGMTNNPGANAAGYQAVNCHVTLATTIEFVQNIISNFRQPLPKWAATNKLNVFPRAGKDVNAFYNRMALKFFFAPDPIAKKMIYTADSTDVVAHELGHAILDAIRPDFWSVQSLEVWAFHEAFADTIALLHMLQFDDAMKAILAETGGDLRKESILSKLAEEVGTTVYNLTDHKSPTLGSLRNAINKFVYVRPELLPEEAPEEELANECHSFGRLFLGAWYDILVGIYELNVGQGKTQLEALRSARDTAATYLIKAVAQAPRTVRFYDAVARVMIALDKAAGAPYATILQGVFEHRKILINEVKILSTDNSWGKIRFDLQKQDRVMQMKDMSLVLISRNSKIKLSDHMATSLSTKDKINLLDLELDVPTDVYYEIDSDGQIVDEITAQQNEILNAAQACIRYIENHNLFGNDKMWFHEGNKLSRKFIS